MWCGVLFWSLFLFGYVSSKTDAEIKEQFTKILMKCTRKYPVQMQDLLQLQQLIAPKKTEVKCLLACTYKTEGTMNSTGMYDLDHVYKFTESAMSDDEKRLTNARKVADICVKVNEEPVSDGDKGCDRAVLIFKCTITQGLKLGFKM